jgi:hypothetical protein
MENLHIANMVAHSGKRKELAKQLLIVQDALDNLARFAGSDYISPTHLKAWTEGLVSSVSYTAMAALDLHQNLTNLDVMGVVACNEQDVNPDELYVAGRRTGASSPARHIFEPRSVDPRSLSRDTCLHCGGHRLETMHHQEPR